MRRALLILALFLAAVPGCVNNQDAAQTAYTDDAVNVAELHLLHNKERASRGLDQLKRDSNLDRSAQEWAQHMADREWMYHSNLKSINYPYKGENIAMGYRNDISVMNGWMHSDGHRANILNKNFEAAGFGIAKSRNGYLYWCAQFGGDWKQQ